MIQTNTPIEDKPVLVGGFLEINFGKQFRQGNRVYNSRAVAMAVTASPVGNQGGYSYLYAVFEGEVGRNPERPTCRQVGLPTQQRLEVIQDCVCGTLSTVQKDNMVMEVPMIVYDDYNKRVKSDQTCIGTVMPNFKNSALRSGTKIIENENKVNFRVRKLTPKECWRLMGFNDEDYYAAKTNSMDVSREILAKYPHEGKRQMDEAERLSRMSNTQLYKQAGNSIVVDVLVHIMENLYDAMPYLFDDIEVGSFFSGIGAFEKALTRLGTDDGNHKSSEIPNAELNQIGYINNYNGDANRVYDGTTVARVLKAEAGGGGAKTGWYSVETSAPERVIIDDTYGFRDEPTVYRDICPTLRAQRFGLKTICE